MAVLALAACAPRESVCPLPITTCPPAGVVTHVSPCLSSGPPRRSVRLRVGETARLFTEARQLDADDTSAIRVYGERPTFIIVGHAPGRTIVRVTDRAGDVEFVDVAVSAGDSAGLALLVGESTTISARGVKSYSSGDKGIADVVVDPDGATFAVVAKKVGTTHIQLIFNDNRTKEIEIVVLGGARVL